MARLMSVAYTEDAVRARIKTVTRRKGWWLDKRGRRLLVPGDHLTLCRKVMGRRKGEPLVRICDVEVLDVRRESLSLLSCPPKPRTDEQGYAWAEVAAEGFPHVSPFDFVQRYFVEAQAMRDDAEVTRIEWRYLDGDPS